MRKATRVLRHLQVGYKLLISSSGGLARETTDSRARHGLTGNLSASHQLARLQLLRYITRVLVQWHRENKRLPLPVVLPVLAHHGPSGWSYSTDFGDLYGSVSDSLRPYLITFRHALVDLARIDDGGLSQHFRLRAFLKALKYVLRADLLEHLDQVLAEARRLNRVDLSLVLKYIAGGSTQVDQQLLRGRFQRVQEKAEMFDRQIADAEFDEACRQADFYRGKATSLIQVLEIRFGPLTEAFRERIYVADASSIEAWLTRAIKENTLQGVFD